MTASGLDIRAVPLPPPWAEALRLLIGRHLASVSDAGAAASGLLRALFGEARPTFGQLHRLSADELRLAAGQAGLGADALPVTRLRELAELLPDVRPDTPICDMCGQFPLSCSGGKKVSLPPGGHCPFCIKGVVRVLPMRLRKIAWTDGRLVEPSVTADLRAVPGQSLPLDDEGLTAWAGEDGVHFGLREELDAQCVPLYGWLAFVNVSEMRLRSLPDAVEALRNPRKAGYVTRQQIAESAAGAAAFLEKREILNVKRENRFPFMLTRDPASLPRMTVKGAGGERTYVLEGLIARGGSCDVYRGAWDDPNTERVVIKVCRGEQSDHARRLAQEASNLTRIANSEAPGAGFFTRLLPTLVQQGTIVAADGTQKHVTVQRYINGHDWTLADVLREYPEGVTPQTMVWMWNRVILQLRFFQQASVVHGALVPSHVLFHPVRHAATLISWGHAAFLNTAAKPVVKPFGEADAAYYPAEVLEGRPATFATDIAMLSRTMIAVLGGNPADGSVPETVPEQIATFLAAHGRYENGPRMQRIDDAERLEKAFSTMVRNIYGERKYVPFHMPRD